MKDVKLFFECIMRVFNIQFNLYGYNITFWQIFIFGWLLGIVGVMLYKLLNR